MNIDVIDRKDAFGNDAKTIVANRGTPSFPIFDYAHIPHFEEVTGDNLKELYSVYCSSNRVRYIVQPAMYRNGNVSLF